MQNLVSIIVPVFNAEPFLARCIESVLKQDYEHLELLLVNDGSTDGSLAICGRYAAADARVSVIDKPNGGVSSARNAALDCARGEWIVFVDADDFLLPGALRGLVDLTALGPDIDFGAASSVKLENGKFRELSSYPQAIQYKPLLRHRDYALWANIFRSSVIRDHNLRFPEGVSYSEDRVFMLQYLAACRAMASTPQRVYAYRIHGASACRTADVVRMARQQFMAARLIESLENDIAEPEAKAVVCAERDFVVRMAVERAAVVNPGSLGKLRDAFTEMTDLKWPSPLPFALFCGLSWLRGLKRRFFPAKNRLLGADTDGEF